MNELDFYVFLMKINCKNWGSSNNVAYESDPENKINQQMYST